MKALAAFFYRYFVFFATLMLGCLVVFGSISLIQRQLLHAAQDRLDVLSTGQAGQLEARLVQQQEVLLGLQAAITLDPNLDRLQFYNLLLQSNVMYRHQGLLAIGLAHPVAPDQLAEHIAKARSDKRVAPLAYQNYKVEPLNEKSTMLLLDYLYPINRLTEQFLGNNLSESKALQDGLNLARDSGRMLASEIFTLPGHQRDAVFCLFAPIYSNLPAEPDVANRREHHVGTVIAFIRINPTLQPLEKTMQHYGLGWQLSDQGYALQTWANDHVASEISRQEVAVGHGVKQTSVQLVHLPARQWRLQINAYSELLDEHQNEWLILAAGVGFIFSLIIASLMQYLYQSRQWSLNILAQAQDEESELRAQMQLLSQAVDENHDPIVLRRADGRIVYANKAANLLFAPAGRGLLGKYEVILSQSEVGDIHHPASYLVPFKAAEDSVKQLQVLLQPIKNKALQTIASAMVVHDMTAWHEQMQELKNSNDRLLEMVNISSDWFWVQDSEFRFTEVAGGFFARLDFNPNFFIGKCRWELGSGGLSEQEWDEHRALLAARQPYRDFEYTSVIGRETLIFSVSGQPFYDEQGQFMGYRGIGRDITPIRHAQKALYSEQQRAQATLESIADGVITTDVFGRVDYLNPVASSLIGWELQAARGQMLSAIYQSVDRSSRLPLPELVSEVLKDGGEYHGSRRSMLLNKFGLNFQVEECAARIRDEQTRTIGAVLVFRDISNWRDLDERAELTLD
ncbi:CHASE domain-containing protein [Chitinibacter bivalviorum]|uniref:CHASE domain-containing protein n=1 Tax=Chitinibacter bivalviorum TaxID=2739434 RepID=A0A7H9BN77_9NEIS|nr:CHASE domain-containing protein [Chitinibacter bivalviorum]QLG89678.1 CHASE domain-containing protein [Chitinibacter bivalviorum]